MPREGYEIVHYKVYNVFSPGNLRTAAIWTIFFISFENKRAKKNLRICNRGPQEKKRRSSLSGRSDWQSAQEHLQLVCHVRQRRQSAAIIVHVLDAREAPGRSVSTTTQRLQAPCIPQTCQEQAVHQGSTLQLMECHSFTLLPFLILQNVGIRMCWTLLLIHSRIMGLDQPWGEYQRKRRLRRFVFDHYQDNSVGQESEGSERVCCRNRKIHIIIFPVRTQALPIRYIPSCECNCQILVIPATETHSMLRCARTIGPRPATPNARRSFFIDPPLLSARISRHRIRIRLQWRPW
jgi:hypothetical protein